MKKLYLAIVLILLISIFVGCNENTEIQKQQLKSSITLRDLKNEDFNKFMSKELSINSKVNLTITHHERFLMVVDKNTSLIESLQVQGSINNKLYTFNRYNDVLDYQKDHPQNILRRTDIEINNFLDILSKLNISKLKELSSKEKNALAFRLDKNPNIDLTNNMPMFLLEKEGGLREITKLEKNNFFKFHVTDAHIMNYEELGFGASGIVIAEIYIPTNYFNKKGE